MKLYWIVLLAAVTSAHAYEILCVFPIPSHSHNQLGKGIVDALLNSGHTVTWVTPYPEKVKNPPKTLKIIDASEVKKYIAGVDMIDTKDTKPGLSFVKQFSQNVSITTMNLKEVKDIVVNKQFDAVVTEAFFNDAMAGLAAVQQAPWILLSPMQMMPNFEAQIDEVRSISTIPLIFNEASFPMTFLDRARNVIMYIVMAFNEWQERPATEALYWELFAPLAAARNIPLPPYKEAYHNVSIMLLNAHESLSSAYSTSPNVINIAGYHIDENPPPLPKDFQELMDNSTQGVIYFSMGSVVRSASFKPHTRAALLAIFAKLPYTVLWKFEEKIEGLPPNVHVRPWMPQPSLLVHPNLKVFITHGGQLSSLEAIQAGVPVLTVPVYGDQHSNAKQAVNAGYALKVDFHEDMAEEFGEKLQELLTNSKYTERVKFLSKIFSNRPVSPAKLLSHYVKLAIESKGAYHLRSLSLNYSCIERWMLDLVGLLGAVIFILILVIRFIYRTIRRKLKCAEACAKTQGSKKKN